MRPRFRTRQRTWPILVIVFILLVIMLLRVKTLFEASKAAEAAVGDGPSLYRSTDTLIIVPGHGVMNALNASEWKYEDKWCLEPHQLRQGVVLPFCFASHIRRSLEILRDRINTSILIFSGGQTCEAAGPRSEALGYYIVAEESKLFGIFASDSFTKKIMRERIFAEEFARDSYENLLFSIARFYEVTWHFPKSIVVVGWKHKAKRFVTYHREAIRFPVEKFTYIGLDFTDAAPFVNNIFPYQHAKAYSDEVALSFVSKDLYLCNAGRHTFSEDIDACGVGFTGVMEVGVMPKRLNGNNEVLQRVLQTVLITNEPAVVVPGSFLGELDVIVDEAKLYGMKLASMPEGGITILPPIPMPDDSLSDLCKRYCGVRTEEERWSILNNLEGELTICHPPKSLPCRTLYQPRHYIYRIVHLCAELASASDEEYQRAYESVPLIHIQPVKSICEELRAMWGSGAFLRDASLKRFVDSYDDGDDKKNLFLTDVAEAPRRSPSPAVQNKQCVLDIDDVTGTEIVDVTTGRIPEYLSEKDFELVRNDCVLLDPSETRVQAIFIRNGIKDKEICRRAALCLEAAATTQNMRKATNGGVTNPETGVVGYYDYLNNPVQFKCRATEFTRKNWNEIAEPCSLLLHLLDDLYQRNAPSYYELQRKVIPPAYRLFNTVFSTMSVNRNFRTASHRDSGDFRGGLTALCVLDGRYEGCHLAIKDTRKAFCLQVGDVLFFDSSLDHGNTEVHNPEAGWRRISLVCYLRCGLMSHVCEMEQSEMLSGRTLIGPLLCNNAEGATDLYVPGSGCSALHIPARIAHILTATQSAAVQFVLRRLEGRDGCVVALTMGLGKTLVSLSICYSYICSNESSDILIVAPKTLLSHWMREEKKWRDYGLVFPEFVVLANTDAVSLNTVISRYERQCSGYSAKKGHIFVVNPAYIRSFLGRAKGFRPGLMIIDEGHWISSKESRLREILEGLNCPLRVVLTGTPVQNNADELYRLVGWVSESVQSSLPQRDFNELSNSINRYVNGDDSAFEAAVSAQRHILEWMRPYVFTVMKADLPPLHDYVLICGFSSVQKEIFKEHIKIGTNDTLLSLKASEHRPYHLSTHPLCFFGFITGIYKNSQGECEEEPRDSQCPLHTLTNDEARLVDNCCDFMKTMDLSGFVSLSGKLTALISILHDIHARREKAVIFSQYVGSQDFIAKTLLAYNVSFVSIRGKDCQDRRRKVVETFMDDKTVLCLVASTQICAYGLDLTAANHVILWDTWWNPQVESQAIARCYRYSQTKPVVAYKLTSWFEDAIILKTQARKRALFRCLMNNQTSQVAPDDELADCTSSEEDYDRRRLWDVLKQCTVNGGEPAVMKVIRNTDTVRSERSPPNSSPY